MNSVSYSYSPVHALGAMAGESGRVEAFAAWRGLFEAMAEERPTVLVFEDNDLWGMKDEVPLDTDFIVPIGKAKTHRAGSDVTIISISGSTQSAEVQSPRCIAA